MIGKIEVKLYLVKMNSEKNEKNKPISPKKMNKNLPNTISTPNNNAQHINNALKNTEHEKKTEKSSLTPENTSNVDLDQEDKFFIALSHEIRRKIIKFIGLHAPTGFTELKKEIQSSTGTIYHHLDVIAEFIYQDEKKKYHLTPIGERAFNFLNLNLQQNRSQNLNEKEKGIPSQNNIINFLLCKVIYRFAGRSELNGYIISGIILTSIAILCSTFKIDLFLFFYLPSESNVSSGDSTFIFLRIYSFLSVFLGFILVFILSEFLCRLFFNKRENWKGLLSLIGIPYLPLLLNLILYAIFISVFEVSNSIFIQLIMFVFQIWSMILLAQSISTAKFLKYERGLMISVFIDYGTFIFLLIVRIQFF